MGEATVHDVTDTFDRQSWINVACRGCGQNLTLYFNGGELDGADCCGFRYRLDYGRIDLVITPPAGGDGTEDSDG